MMNKVTHFGLSKRQKETLDFIKQYDRETGGVSPSYAEIADGLSLKSKSGVVRLIDGLETRGYISRSARARSIMLLD